MIAGPPRGCAGTRWSGMVRRRSLFLAGAVPMMPGMAETLASDTRRFVERLTGSGFTERQAGTPRPAAMRPVDKPARVRSLGAVDVEPLRSRVLRLSRKVWRREDAAKENAFPCFHHTRHVIIRYIAGNRDPRCFYSNPIWRVWKPMLLPLMARAAAPYGYADPVYPKVMLARLEAGHGIEPHIDYEGSHPFVHKIHVPLTTEPQAVVRVDGVDFHLEAGRAFEINNLVLHSAYNGGKRDRIHLIFEVYDAAPPVPA